MNSQILRQRGVTLIEILLVAVIVAAAAIGVFIFSKNTNVSAAVKSEQAQVERLVQTVESLFAAKSNFSDLGTDGAQYLLENAPSSGLTLGRDASGQPTLLTGLGSGKGSVQLRATSVEFSTGVPTSPDNGFALLYSGLSSAECVNLVTATASRASRIDVDTTSEMTSPTLVSERGVIISDRSELARVCNPGSSSPFVQLSFAPNRATADLPPPSTPLAQCRPTRETQSTGCPAGQSGSIVQERVGNCTGPGNSLVYTAWTTIEDTCALDPTLPPDETPDPIVDDCAETTFTRSTACPGTDIGQIVETRVVNSCDSTSTPWTEVSRTCGPPPVSTCTPSSQQQTISCPPGQGGNQVQVRSSSCPTPTSAPVWGSWSTISNNCTSSCAATGTCCTAQRQTQTVMEPCPAGTYGDSGREEERFLGCVNATTQAPNWTPWQVVNSSGTCTACPPNVIEDGTQWVDRTQACPSGSGVIEFEAEQARTRTTSYSCPAGTTSLPAPTVGAWSSWTDTGARRNVDTSKCGGGDCYDYRLEAMGTLDAHDAFFTIQYTINGVAGGCTATRRDDGLTGAGNCRGGNNGVFDIGEWSLRAAPGDTYAEIGSTSGWEQERHQFWGWEHHVYTKNNTPCATGCRFEVESENYSPLGTGYQTFWRNEYSDNSGTHATLYCQESASTPGQLSCDASGPGFNFSGVYNGSTLAAALPVGWKWMRERELGLSDVNGDGSALASNPGAAITFDFQIDGTGIGSGSYVRAASCTTPPASCPVPSGTVFNWRVGTNSCTYTQGSATTIATGGTLTANDNTPPTTGQAEFSCTPSTHPITGDDYSSGLDVACSGFNNGTSHMKDAVTEINEYCSANVPGASGYVGWCEQEQVAGGATITCPGAPVISPNPRPGATCQMASVPVYSDAQTCIHDSVGACVAGDSMPNGGQNHGSISHSVTITWNGESRRVKVHQPDGSCPPQPAPAPGAERSCVITRVSQNFTVGGRLFTVSVRGSGRELILGDPPFYTKRWVITAYGERDPATP